MDQSSVEVPAKDVIGITGAFVRVLSKDFTEATEGMVREEPGTGGLTGSRSASATLYLQWKVTLPKAGKWYLHASLAAAERRPGTLIINGEKQGEPVCGNVTNGWSAANLRWFVHGPFDFKQGENVFRIDFPNVMPSLKEFGFSESLLGAVPATIMTKDLTAKSPTTEAQAEEYSNLTKTHDAAGYVEWRVSLPQAGKWQLHALMTAHASRPCALTINGATQSARILGQVTGSWYSDKLTWFVYGPYDFVKGENLIRLDGTSYLPHLRELGFTPEKGPEPAISAADWEKARARLAELEREIATLSGKLAKCGECAVQIAALEKKVDDQAKQIDALTTAAAKCDDCATKLAEQATRISALEAKLEGAGGAPDDLRIIEGIGEKIAAILTAGGIATFKQLAATDVSRIKEVIAAAGMRAPADPSSWPAQAKLAAEGRMDELRDLQSKLTGGRA